MEQRDFYLREIEKIMVLISKILNCDNNSTENTKELRLAINKEYQRLFSISENEINLDNKIIQDILNYEGNENHYIQKLEAFVLLLEHDYEHFNKKDNLRIVLYSLMKKLIQVDNKNYHPKRMAKLFLYEEKHLK